jgi:DNA-binding NarL/FixJ family response regulator
MYRKIVNGTTANFGSINDPYVLRGKGKIAERRQRMLMLAAAGMSDQEIAIETGYTVNTVRQALYGNRRVHDEKEERDYGV